MLRLSAHSRISMEPSAFIDPQLKCTLEQFADGALFFHDSENEEEVMPGFGRAKARGFIREIGGGGFATGAHYELTRSGREAIGLFADRKDNVPLFSWWFSTLRRWRKA